MDTVKADRPSFPNTPVGKRKKELELGGQNVSLSLLFFFSQFNRTGKGGRDPGENKGKVWLGYLIWVHFLGKGTLVTPADFHTIKKLFEFHFILLGCLNDAMM